MEAVVAGIQRIGVRAVFGELGVDARVALLARRDDVRLGKARRGIAHREDIVVPWQS